MASETDDSVIRRLLDAQARAIQARDADAALAHYDPAVVNFDLAAARDGGRGRAGARASLEDWFATWEGPIGYELRDIDVTVGDGVAFCHGFVRIRGTKIDGERPDFWARHTVCLHRRDDAWRMAHTHTSVPFHMDGSLLAAVDLRP